MKATHLGIGSALTASACCVGPAALAAAGLGGLGLGIWFVRYAGWLVGAAALLLLAGWWTWFRENRRCAKAQCRMPGGKGALAALSIASVVVAGFALLHLGPLLSRAGCAISCLRRP